MNRERAESNLAFFKESGSSLSGLNEIPDQITN